MTPGARRMTPEPTTEVIRAGRPAWGGGGGGGLHQTEPFIQLVVWKGPLSQLQCRLGIEISHDKLKEISREKRGNQFSIDINVANNAPIWNALRRRLAGGDGG